MAGARKKKARSQPHLTSERVRDEALRLIEAEGLEGFSTRKLGRALGVEAMAIYWYYPSKDALLDAVVDRLVSKLESPVLLEGEGEDARRREAEAEPARDDASGGAAAAPAETLAEPAEREDFIDGLRRLAHAYRALAHAYPNAFPLLATRRFATPGAYRFLDRLFALAEEHGFDARTTARFYRAVACYCSGIALDELAGLRELESRNEVAESRSSMPRLAAVFEWLAPEHYEDVFSFGLELLLRSLREHAATRAVTPAAKRSASRKSRA